MQLCIVFIIALGRKKCYNTHKRQKVEGKVLQTEAKISPEELLAEGRTIQIKPQGYSMYPLFVPGRDSAVIAPPKKCGRDSAVIAPPEKSGRDSAVIVPPEKCGGQNANIQDRKGDVVLYRGEGQKLILHRICRLRKEKNGSTAYYMAGDNQSRLEGPIYQEQIKGVLVAVIRKGKTFTVNNLIYRVVFTVWCWLRPVRPQIAGTAAKIKRSRIKTDAGDEYGKRTE